MITCSRKMVAGKRLFIGMSESATTANRAQIGRSRVAWMG